MQFNSLVGAGLVRLFGPNAEHWIRAARFIRALDQDEPVGFEKELLLLRRLVSPGDTCLDVGASYGLYTYYLSKLVGGAGHVHSFEPLPYSFRVLQVVRAWFTLENVSVHRIALSDSSGDQFIVIPKTGAGTSEYGWAFLKGTFHEVRKLHPDFDSTEEVECKTTTVDEFISDNAVQNVRFIKCDVEGAEFKVLRGAEKTIRAQKPTLLCEIEERHTQKYEYRPADVMEWLKHLGYRAFIYHSGHLDEVKEVTLQERNHIFMPAQGD